MLRPNYIYKFMTLLPKDYYLIPSNRAKNLLRRNYIYKFMTLLPKDYYLIPSNHAKNLLRRNYIYKFMTLLPKDYYLIPDNGAKNLLRPNYVCDVISVCQTAGTATQELFSPQQQHKKLVDQISDTNTKGILSNPRKRRQKLVNDPMLI